MKKYKINGNEYYQKPLVIGQVSQIIKLVKDINFPEEFSSVDVVGLLGEKLPEACAVILREKDKKLKDKDIEALAEEFEENLDAKTAVKIIEDFFELNDVKFFLQKLQEIGEKAILEKTNKKLKE